VLGFELRAFILSHSTSHFVCVCVCVVGFFEIGSCELFAQAGFERQSSRSLPPESRIIGVSHRRRLLLFTFQCS
jgi:hypothetical protein